MLGEELGLGRFGDKPPNKVIKKTNFKFKFSNKSLKNHNKKGIKNRLMQIFHLFCKPFS